MLRLRPGAAVEVADAGGGVFAGTVLPGGLVRLGAPLAPAGPPAPLAVRLALAGPRADTAVEKLVELGVETLGPLVAGGLRHDARTDRWERVAAAAAEQAKRPRRPAVAPPLPLADALRDPGALMLSHEEPDATLAEALGRLARPVLLLVGPESGFTAAEHAAAREGGVPIVTLGPVVLRSETAAIVGAALVLDRLGALA